MHRVAPGRVPPADRATEKTFTCFVNRGGEVARWEFDAPDLDDGDFAALGAELRDLPWVRTGLVGHAPAYLLPIRQAVDFARVWMSGRRSARRY